MTTRFRINHVSIVVGDTDRALAFYSDLLGLEVDDARPDLGFPGAWLKTGNGQIHLLELPDTLRNTDPDLHGGRDSHFALDIEDLDEVIALFENAGITYTLSRSGRRALFCRDPDGNAVELIEISG